MSILWFVTVKTVIFFIDGNLNEECCVIESMSSSDLECKATAHAAVRIICRYGAESFDTLELSLSFMDREHLQGHTSRYDESSDRMISAS